MGRRKQQIRKPCEQTKSILVTNRSFARELCLPTGKAVLSSGKLAIIFYPIVLSFEPPRHPFIYTSIHPLIFSSVCPPLSSSIPSFTHLSICLFSHVSICLPIHSFTQPHVSIYPMI